MVVHQFSIDKFRNGDRIEFEYVFGLYYDTMYLFANNLIRSEPESKDIATESFIKLWKLHANFESKANIKAFLYVTTRNACLDHLRFLKMQRVVKKEVSYLLDIEDHTHNEQISAEVIAHLMQKIEGLPDRCKAVFKLFYFHQRRTSEIAAHLRMSPQTVLNQKTRAIRMLRSSLLKPNIIEGNASLGRLHLDPKNRILQNETPYSSNPEQHIYIEEVDVEASAHIKRKIEKLPDRCKAVFKLSYFDHLETSEIAVKLNISAQTVLNHKSRAIRILRPSLLKLKGLEESISLFS